MRIVIRPSGSHPDILTIRDATEQVRDIFELAEGDNNSSVAWKLVSATTNTPLTIAAELVSMNPAMSPGALAALARDATERLDNGLTALATGHIIPDWAAGPKAVVLKRVLKRNLNGVGRTDIQINDATEPDVLTPTLAATALHALEQIEQPKADIDRTRVEVGSIDGDYLNLGHHYGHPAIRVRERKTGREIPCWVSENDLEKISEHVRAADVWRNRRVKARGKLFFGSNGDILHVEAIDIELFDIDPISIDDVRDRNFTGGLSVSQFLERFREGELG